MLPHRFWQILAGRPAETDPGYGGGSVPAYVLAACILAAVVGWLAYLVIA